MSEIIKIENVSKSYKIYINSKDRLREVFSLKKKKYHKIFYALKDINIKINRGETLGIIGKNGAGKSTLLKIITGVLTPSIGKIEVSGKIAALLELGAGFNMEYTGIENIYLNGTLMGFSREEMDEKINEILKFADIGDFVNQPVKNYSSGMFARLAFSVSINVNPDILIVDEALAVGDIFFQNKCFKKFEELKNNGVTILFVSHDLSSIRQMCDKVLWINKGEQIMFGTKEKVCDSYLNMKNNFTKAHVTVGEIKDTSVKEKLRLTEELSLKKSFPKIIGNEPLNKKRDGEILSFFILDSFGKKSEVLFVEKEYTFHIVAKFNKKLKDILFGFVLENNKGIPLLSINNFLSSKIIEEVSPEYVYEVKFSLEVPKISKGEYILTPAIATGNQKNHKTIHWIQNCQKIEIINEGYNLSLLEIKNKVKVEKMLIKNVELK